VKNYFISLEGKQTGPHTFEGLKNLSLTSNHLVWCEGMPEWVKAHELPELKDFVLILPPPIKGTNPIGETFDKAKKMFDHGSVTDQHVKDSSSKARRGKVKFVVIGIFVCLFIWLIIKILNTNKTDSNLKSGGELTVSGHVYKSIPSHYYSGEVTNNYIRFELYFENKSKKIFKYPKVKATLVDVDGNVLKQIILETQLEKIPTLEWAMADCNCDPKANPDNGWFKEKRKYYEWESRVYYPQELSNISFEEIDLEKCKFEIISAPTVDLERTE
jgi:hypothetical protein